MTKKTVRCAIYTRKSTEEELDQTFNTLHAQREACEFYIQSQRHEGWVTLPTLYDDGGFSGGNMDRPALKQLMADIEDGLIDTVVVYKVDRLTRALTERAFSCLNRTITFRHRDNSDIGPKNLSLRFIPAHVNDASLPTTI